MPKKVLLKSLKHKEMCHNLMSLAIMNRPGIAGAVLQSPPWLADWLIDSYTDPLVQISSKHCQSQTRRAKEWHMSHVTCPVSPVACTHIYLFLLRKK